MSVNNTGFSASNNAGVNIPNAVLRSVLNDTGDRINFCHINAGSLSPKIDEFRNYFEMTKCHIIVATETWFKKHTTNKSIEIPGFTVVLNDRFRCRSGGVAIFVRVGINFRVVFKSANLKTEILLLELIFPHSKLLVGGVYKAPSVDEITELGDVLSRFTPQYGDAILLGDFNEDQLPAI